VPLLTGDPALLDPDAHEAMLTPALEPGPEESFGYGLGVEVDAAAGYRRVGHSGDGPGFHGHAHGCAETGVGVVVLCNGPWRPAAAPGGTWVLVDHGLALLRAAVLGLAPPEDPAPADEEDQDAAAGAGREPPGELAALVGTYAAYNPWVPQVQVRADRDGDGLVLVWPWGDVRPLVALADGSFRVGEDHASPERVRFRAVVEGRPAQVVVSGWPFDRVD